MRDPDTITDDDLPALRTDCTIWAGDEEFSGTFRDACRALVGRIDEYQALPAQEGPDEAVDSHPAQVTRQLEDEIRQWFAAAGVERERVERLERLFDSLDTAIEHTQWRQLLVEMVPLLSDLHILGLRSLVMDAAATVPTFPGLRA